MIGLANAGKTLLVKQLLNQVTKKKSTSAGNGTEIAVNPVTNPTIGFDTNTLKISGEKKGSKADVFLNEVGSAMISTWHQFTANSKSILVSGLSSIFSTRL